MAELQGDTAMIAVPALPEAPRPLVGGCERELLVRFDRSMPGFPQQSSPGLRQQPKRSINERGALTTLPVAGDTGWQEARR
jgi:hypothetical protein